MKRHLTILILPLLMPPAAWSQHEHHGASPATSLAAPAGARPARSEWTRQPLLLPGKNPRGERATAQLRTQGIAAAALTVFATASESDWLL